VTLRVVLILAIAQSVVFPFARMRDGKLWTTTNLDVDVRQSYCYADNELNCGRYGRLYTWPAAQSVCRTLGDGWRLPTDDEWRQLAKQYGGVGGDLGDGKAAYEALVDGSGTGFNARLGGSRSADGRYDRLDAHGFYWTASARNEQTAPFYNFGKGSLALYRQPEGGKQMAASVRCVRD